MHPEVGVSLVLATVGRTLELAHFIDHLARQSVRGFELIVVDQNGDDRLVPIVADAGARGIDVQHLRFTRRSLSAARNFGLRACRFPIVGIPDDDCWYEPTLIESVLEGFVHRPDAAVLVGHWVEGEPDSGFPEQIPFEDFRRFRGGPTDSLRLFFRTELVRDGGFDERLGVPLWFGAAEETDLVMRLLAAGHIVARMRTIRMHHPPKLPDEFKGLREIFRRTRGYERATGALYYKHRLPIPVVARGLIAPVARAAINVGRPKRLVSEIASAVGRVEGLLRWMRIDTRPK